MMKTGEFAKAGRVSVKTLHHYDDIGLLKPCEIDSKTGYRLYSHEKLVQLNQILALKEAGFTLIEIQAMTVNQPERQVLIQVLEAKASELEGQIQFEQERLHRLRTNVFLLKNGGFPVMHEIVIKKVEPILAATIRQTIDSYVGMESMWTQLNTYIEEKHIRKVTPCMTLYHNGWDTTRGMDVEVVEPVSKQFEDSDLVTVYTLEGVEQMACIVHKGPFETISQTYEQLENWVQSNHYTLAGPVREIYHKGDWLTDQPNEYVTEIQWPIERA